MSENCFGRSVRQAEIGYLGDCGAANRGLAQEIRRVLLRSRHPLTVRQIVRRLRGAYREFSIVTMVERLDERCSLVALRMVKLGGVVGYTMPEKLDGYRRAGVLGEVKVWRVPDLRATLEDLEQEGVVRV